MGLAANLTTNARILNDLRPLAPAVGYSLSFRIAVAASSKGAVLHQQQVNYGLLPSQLFPISNAVSPIL
jgi:hypothetical protein